MADMLLTDQSLESGRNKEGGHFCPHGQCGGQDSREALLLRLTLAARQECRASLSTTNNNRLGRRFHGNGMSDDPYQPPHHQPDSESGTIPPRSGGIRRLPYWITFIVLISAFLALVQAGRIDAYPNYGMSVFWIANMIPASLRFKNIGMNPWLSLLMIVPLLNIFVIFRCLIFQENYQTKRKLDSTGKILVGVVILSALCLAVGMIIEAWSPVWWR